MTPNDRSFSIRLLLIAVGILWIPSLILPPEGSVRSGDSLPLVLPWLALLAVFSFVRGGELFFRFIRDKEKSVKRTSAKRTPPKGPFSVPKMVSRAAVHSDESPLPPRRLSSGSSSTPSSDPFHDSFPAFRSRRIVWPDLFAVALLIWMGISWLTLRITHSGNPVYAANMFWTCALMIVVYFLIRTARPFFRLHLESILLAGLLTAALFETGLALHAYFVTDPAMREAFQKDPDSLLRESGLNYEKGSSEYLLLEKRVLASSEPLGSYGMTNTLAGFLVPTLILLTGILFTVGMSFFRKKTSDFPSSKPKIGMFPATAIIYLLVAGVLILTKSRSAYLALTAGTLGVFFMTFWGNRQGESPSSGETYPLTSRRRPLWIGVAVILLTFTLAALVAFHFGFLDAEVFTEAKKSLGFRLDYWTATLQMTAEHPIFGVGPGNFQTVYPRYILPTAGETIADPHNFLLEWTAVFGIPAAILFLAFAFSLIPTARFQYSPTEIPILKIGESIPLVAGGYVALLILNFMTSAPTDIDFLLGFAVPFLLIVVLTVGNVMNPNRISSPLLLIALGALLLNLSAAGGIAFPAVTLPFWGLAGILVNRRESAREKTDSTSKPFPTFFLFFGITGLTIVGLALLQITALAPRQAEREALFSSDTPIQNVNRSGRYSIPLNQNACFSALSAYALSPTETNRTAWEVARKQLFEVAPGSAAVRAGAGQVEFEAYERTHRPGLLDASIDSLSEAVKFFPTDAVTHARLAVALENAGRRADAAAERDAAFRLDEITPHEDRKIPGPLRSVIRSSIDAPLHGAPKNSKPSP